MPLVDQFVVSRIGFFCNTQPVEGDGQEMTIPLAIFVVTVGIFSQHHQRVIVIVRSYQIHAPVPVDIRRRHTNRPATHDWRRGEHKTADAIIGQNRERVGAIVGGNQIHLAIPVDIRRRDRKRRVAHDQRGIGTEAIRCHCWSAP